MTEAKDKPQAAHTAPLAAELLALNQRLLDSITAADWQTYDELCDPTLSAFEPEARGRLVEGMPFHKFYFDLGKPKMAPQATMTSPHVRLLGPDAAVISYVRLVQKLDAAGARHQRLGRDARLAAPKRPLAPRAFPPVK